MADRVYKVLAHRVRIMSGRYVDASGADLDPGRGFAPVRQDHVQVNHYVLKSREEFESKRRRGCVLRPVGDPMKLAHIPDGYFEEHDRNEEVDESILRHIAPLREEISRIDAILDAAKITRR